MKAEAEALRHAAYSMLEAATSLGLREVLDSGIAAGGAVQVTVIFPSGDVAAWYVSSSGTTRLLRIGGQQDGAELTTERVQAASVNAAHIPPYAVTAAPAAVVGPPSAI